MNSNFWEVFLFLLGTFIIGNYTGWVSAHNEIAAESIRQGSFYVDDMNFDCALRYKEGKEM